MEFKDLYETVIKELDEKLEPALINRIKSYINRAYKELAKREGLEKAIVVNINKKIIKPGDLIRAIQIIDENSNPISFGYEGMYIKTDYIGKGILIYNYIPETLVNDNDTPETNAANEDFIINYAKWLYNMVEEQEETAKIYKVEYETMQLIKNNYKLTKTIDVYKGGEDIV